MQTHRLFFRNDKGLRDYQEDAFIALKKGNRLMLVVADGMGGYSGGNIASARTVESFTSIFKKERELPAEIILENGLKESLKALKKTNLNIGTTVVAAIIEKGKHSRYKLTYTWVGDSRIYVYTPRRHNPTPENSPIQSISLPEGIRPSKQKLWLLTRDDSLVWGLFSKGEITLDQLTAHPVKSQLQLSLHVKQEKVPIRIGKAVLQENDLLFLCTDGVWESFQSHSIMLEIFELNKAEQIHKKLCEYLNKAVTYKLCDDNNTYILAPVNKNIFKNKIASLIESICSIFKRAVKKGVKDLME